MTGVVGLLLVASALAPSAGAEAGPEAVAGPSCAALIAHRGGAAYDGMTEGGLNAIHKTVDSMGVARFEVDLRTTSSDTIFVMHDATVDRTTDGTGPVAAMTSTEMAALRLDDGERVPTLRNVLAFVDARPGVDVVLHVKSMTDVSWARLASRIRSYAVQSQVTLMGPRWTVARARSIFERVATVRLSPTPLVSTSGGVAIAESQVTSDNVAANHANGVTYWAFSPGPDRWSDLAAAGVDGMFVNDVEAYLAVCAP